MKSSIRILLLLFYAITLPGQTKYSAPLQMKEVDTIIVTQAYTSYFSYHYKNPVMVTYELYKGGGKCSRKAFHFKNDIPGLPAATPKDYAHNNYDEGHLCDAADMAYDCTLDEVTFRFYNCVPQTAALNRGPWKQWETKIRKESQGDSLFIVAGSVFSSEFIGDSIYVPALCYKVVYSLTTGNVLHSIICSNTATPECKEIDIEKLLEEIKH
jgi:DNA/RNA endonuclease G (NUC1)